MESAGTASFISNINKPLPSVLYKYCSFESLKLTLKHGTFRANPPISENDTAECLPEGLDHEGLVRFVNESPSLKSRIAKTLQAFGEKANKASIEAWLKKIGPDVISGLENARTPKRWREWLSAHAAFVSFTEHTSSEYMWKEYGDNHKGARMSFASSLLPNLVNVRYDTKRISLNPEFDGGSQELHDNILAWLTTKECNGRWNQEDEWRIIVKWRESERKLDGQGLPFMTIPFDSSALLEVQLGHLCGQGAESIIRPLLSCYPNTKLTNEPL